MAESVETDLGNHPMNRQLSSWMRWVSMSFLPVSVAWMIVQFHPRIVPPNVALVLAHVAVIVGTLTLQGMWLGAAGIHASAWVWRSSLGLLVGGVCSIAALSLSDVFGPEWIGTLTAMLFFGLGLGVPQQLLFGRDKTRSWLPLSVLGWLVAGIVWRWLPILRGSIAGSNEISLLSCGFVAAAAFTGIVAPRVPSERGARAMHAGGVGVLIVVVATQMGSGLSRAKAIPQPGGCDSSIVLASGFCATVYADTVGVARHIAVAPNGDVYVALWDGPSRPGGVLALRDTNGDGRADVRHKFGDKGGSGLSVRYPWLYFSTWTSVFRYRLDSGTLGPIAPPDTILSGLPESGHSARSIVVTPKNELFVNIGAPTNACQRGDRALESLGEDPCPSRDNFAGLWKFGANKIGQRQPDGVRYVSGLRHAVALTQHPETGVLYAVQHGRDELAENWPRLYSARDGQAKPAEEFLTLNAGSDFGWPYCYYDGELQVRVLAPEYGGDGRRTGRCAGLPQPLVALPAHWAPNGILFYTGSMFPKRYRGAAFIAFHGGWFRPPPDNGFNVTFVPFANGKVTALYEVFADGFAGKRKRPAHAPHRPVGLAQDSTGALLVTDDVGGRIWRIVYSPP